MKMKKNLLNFEHRWKLRKWIPIDKLEWECLSWNPSAIHLLEANPEKIDWDNLSENPSAIHLLETNTDKINWTLLSSNPSAIHLLEANPEKIYWEFLSKNPSIFELDYDFFFNRMNLIREELIGKDLESKTFSRLVYIICKLFIIFL
jgi:hypothetical protein